jgi:tyrosinase
MFRDTSSELYVANRNTWMNNGSGSLPTTDVLYDDAFAYIDYPSANDTIQGTPHSSVHVDVGGWMGVVETAAQDPIFYLHHCNIDRLWNLWLAQHGGRADPVADSTWTGKVSTFFDEHGHEVQMRPCEVLRAAQQLRYAYENEPAQVNDYCQPPHIRIPHYAETTLLHIPPPPENLGARPVTFPLFKTATLRERLLAIMKNTSSTLLLRFDNIVAEEQPGVTWDVFVGLPHGAAPDPNGPFYVGNLALFGSGIRSSVHSGRKFVPATFRYRVGRALLESIRRNEATVTATFVPHGVLVDGKLSHPAPRSTVRIGSATLLVRRERAH